MRHEIVNDREGGGLWPSHVVPCVTQQLFLTRTSMGRSKEICSIGKLRNSDLVMYDRITESWCQQIWEKPLSAKLPANPYQGYDT